MGLLITFSRTGKHEKVFLISYNNNNGVLLYEDHLVLSAKFSWVPIWLREIHSTPQGGHYVFYRRIAANLFWFGMKKKFQQFVRE